VSFLAGAGERSKKNLPASEKKIRLHANLTHLLFNVQGSVGSVDRLVLVGDFII
jgi:hypothetical protein